MQELTLLHNPKCSKSRATLALLEARGHVPGVRRYLDEPLTAEELRVLLRRLDVRAHDVVRTDEAAYAKAGLHAGATDDDVIQAITAHPILLQRPIVILGEHARIGRPPERVLELL